MTYFLAKTDPDTYSYRRSGAGKTDHLGRRHQPPGGDAIRDMRPAIACSSIIAAARSAVVGLATVRSAGRPDPKNPKSAVVDLAFAEPAGSSHHPGGNEAIRPVQGLGPGASRAPFDHGRPGEFVEWMRARYPGKDLEAPPGPQHLRPAGLARLKLAARADSSLTLRRRRRTRVSRLVPPRACLDQRAAPEAVPHSGADLLRGKARRLDGGAISELGLGSAPGPCRQRGRVAARPLDDSASGGGDRAPRYGARAPLARRHQASQATAALPGPGVADNGAGLAALLALAAAWKAAPPLPGCAAGPPAGRQRRRGRRRQPERHALLLPCRMRTSPRRSWCWTAPTPITSPAGRSASRRFEVAVTGPGGHSWSDYGTAIRSTR